MNKEEILEYNKRCAEFLDYELITPNKRRNPDEWKYSYWEHKNKANIHTSKKVLGRDEYLSFHSDWNWIMEIVEAIEKLDNFYVQIEESACYIYDISKFTDEQCNPFISCDLKLSSKKEAVIQAINQFLIWYNENRT